jgi:hypothetical protein
MRRLVWLLFLRPLVMVNYRLRFRGLIADKMFWADSIGTGWGFTYDPPWLKRRMFAEGYGRPPIRKE